MPKATTLDMGFFMADVCTGKALIAQRYVAAED
jgi:hypothetical protein